MSFWGHDAVAKIDANRAAQEAEAGAQLLDVGQPDDWFGGHLPHAILIDADSIDQEMKKLVKDKPVIVAARDNELAVSATDLLHDHGFDVAMIEGGIAAWKGAGHPLVKADGTKA